MNQQQKDDLKVGDVIANRSPISGNIGEARIIVISVENAPIIDTVVAHDPWYPGVHRRTLDLNANLESFELVEIPRG